MFTLPPCLLVPIINECDIMGICIETLYCGGLFCVLTDGLKRYRVCGRTAALWLGVNGGWDLGKEANRIIGQC